MAPPSRVPQHRPPNLPPTPPASDSATVTYVGYRTDRHLNKRISYGMKSVQSPLVKAPTKAPTGIAGFDEITGGGLPRGRTTLLVGGSGSGKTVLALQFLVHGAQNCKEPGVLVAFEENS